MINGTPLLVWLKMIVVAGLAIAIYHKVLNLILINITFENDFPAIDKTENAPSNDDADRVANEVPNGIFSGAGNEPETPAKKKRPERLQKERRKAPVKEWKTEKPETEEPYVMKNGIIQLQDTIKLREEARKRELAQQAGEFMENYEKLQEEKKRRMK